MNTVYHIVCQHRLLCTPCGHRFCIALTCFIVHCVHTAHYALCGRVSCCTVWTSFVLRCVDTVCRVPHKPVTWLFMPTLHLRPAGDEDNRRWSHCVRWPVCQVCAPLCPWLTSSRFGFLCSHTAKVRYGRPFDEGGQRSAKYVAGA